jgi:hypothetical protein
MHDIVYTCCSLVWYRTILKLFILTAKYSASYKQMRLYRHRGSHGAAGWSKYIVNRGSLGAAGLSKYILSPLPTDTIFQGGGGVFQKSHSSRASEMGVAKASCYPTRMRNG